MVICVFIVYIFRVQKRQIKFPDSNGRGVKRIRFVARLSVRCGSISTVMFFSVSLYFQNSEKVIHQF